MKKEVLFGALLFSSIAGAQHINSAPNDPLFSQQWGLSNQDNGFELGIQDAWKIEQGDKNIAIAIIGSGIDYTHPDLIDSMWTNPNEIPNNGIDDDNNGYIDDVHGINTIDNSGDVMDYNGHETHVAGIIGAQVDNGIGIAGVMANVSLIACKFINRSGSGNIANAVKCLDYIAQLANRNDIGVRIVATNNAWGGGNYSHAMQEAINRHRDLGILFVTGAASGMNLDEHKVYPASYDSSNIIVVAKMNRQGSISSFSGYGANTVHLAAPGEDIISTTLNHGYGFRSGSSATGFVSGTIGLISSHYPKLEWAQVKHRLLSSVMTLATTQDQGRVISGGFCKASLALSN